MGWILLGGGYKELVEYVAVGGAFLGIDVGHRVIGVEHAESNRGSHALGDVDDRTMDGGGVKATYK